MKGEFCHRLPPVSETPPPPDTELPSQVLMSEHTDICIHRVRLSSFPRGLACGVGIPGGGIHGGGSSLKQEESIEYGANQLPRLRSLGAGQQPRCE